MANGFLSGVGRSGFAFLLDYVMMSKVLTLFDVADGDCSRGQFHQHSTRSFYVRKLQAQLFCAYNLGLYFTGVNLPAQKLCVKR